MSRSILAIALVCCVQAAEFVPWTNGVPTQMAKGAFPEEKYRQYLLAPFDNKAFFPVFATQPIHVGAEGVYPEITSAVIWHHGAAGNANSYFNDGVAVTRHYGIEKRILTAGPWFGKTEVTASFWNSALPKGLKSIYWNGLTWVSGGGCVSDVGVQNCLSYGVLDAVVSQLKNHPSFPNMKRLSFAGFSAGCQLASRWSFFSSTLAPSEGDKVETQVVVADCGTFMYVDERRPSASCRQPYNTGLEHTCTSFEKPDLPLAEYDKFKFGLYEANPGREYSASELQALKEAFPKKGLRFLIGDQDACNCMSPTYNNPDYCFHPTLTCAPLNTANPDVNSHCCDTFPDTFVHNVVDSSIAGLLQGENRLQRMLNYMSYLKDVYQDPFFPVIGVFEGGHNSTAFGYSPTFYDWVLSDKTGASASASDSAKVLIM
mmetsp:Transcript_20555/g.33166  ORF Transcript_20555/g.33166 Transcript_20555/m.33166 type:complete len:430 (+) Transcript_20555:48-1337(+)|eukprot:CAMPEP_0169109496 /NCGR_PEP_ID=MMETSP1015-20121227/25996_1 /TAXON_ID=342587 /ORGANISM="Karlodinium micrum, Strain CCMP2283" /LENGTH=429 /DNA_ID=CAMNT_0009171197 /DNA_START=44 /DNA_END=1333 /DNA_ORIENTATION=+